MLLAAGDLSLTREFGAGAICTGRHPILYDGPRNPVDLYYANYFARHGNRPVPTWQDWNLEFDVHHLPHLISQDKILEIIEHAGKRYGFSDPPNTGLFNLAPNSALLMTAAA